MLLRYFDFDYERIGYPEAQMFNDTIMAILGCEPGQKPDALLSSLPSELCFNDLRDASRRHSKAEKCSMASIHSVAHKSAVKRSMGCGSLDLLHTDWSQPMSQSAIRTTVMNCKKCTDSSLGIDATKLTKNRSDKAYTKPHIYTQRLELLNCLSSIYNSTPGDEETKKDKIYEVHGSMWMSKLIPTRWMIRRTGSEEGQQCAMVLRSGPYFVEIIQMVSCEGESRAYTLSTKKCQIEEWVIKGLEEVEVALVKPVVENNRFAWKRFAAWMKIVDAVTYHTICDIQAQTLNQLCRHLGFKQPANLSHRLRVELFLKKMKCDAAYIKEVLEKLPVRKSRKQVDADGNAVQEDVS